MSRRRNAARAIDGWTVPGLYESLLKSEWDRCTQPDPRTDAPIPPTACSSPLLDMLEDGAPVTIPRWRVGGNNFPQARQIPWVAARSCRSITVWADDTVVPVDGPAAL